MSANCVDISYMKIEDVEDILAVENSCFTVPWSKESFMQELSNKNLAIYICARVEKIAIAYAGMWRICDEGHITNIAVHPQYRRNGIGGRLVQHLINIAKNEKISRITLEVRKSNVIAQKLYTRYGFKVDGVRKEYYSDNGEDAVIMWKNNI
ncbi:ribosomal protein S18-alanine N-acetyltransferase [Herbivorax sp. ANBcel31]|uniref:ribosomal protein S18-alanine N-acetyltransferase n=1 Tax=Herbivorax sp. ANBcel31 TaxID=3069754 RepID=UPI0027AF128A|nr:ribosomal protein S18-alanine N-acetyltransferase [Herbivorax sp. ANBcel31]MDQ2086214.1 ribosomal protein S18-alanine N-acetyltransferase [Herbivorax sp. ANBcel31]